MATQQNEKPKGSKIVKVKIVKDGHEDGGKPVAKGETVEVPEPVAEMLIKAEIAEAV